MLDVMQKKTTVTSKAGNDNKTNTADSTNDLPAIFGSSTAVKTDVPMLMEKQTGKATKRKLEKEPVKEKEKEKAEESGETTSYGMLN
jgi:hypothetical protein